AIKSQPRIDSVIPKDSGVPAAPIDSGAPKDSGVPVAPIDSGAPTDSSVPVAPIDSCAPIDSGASIVPEFGIDARSYAASCCKCSHRNGGTCEGCKCATSGRKCINCPRSMLGDCKN